MPALLLMPEWSIEGTLVTRGPVRIGDGSILKDRIPHKNKKAEQVETPGVFVKPSGNRAYLPRVESERFSSRHR